MSVEDSDYVFSTIPLHPYLIGDREIITRENHKTFIQTLESVNNSVQEWGPSIYYVHDEFIGYDLCVKAIENHNGAICSIKRHLLKEEEYYNLCLLSVSKNGWNMKEIPKVVQSQELCNAAIKSICWGYKYCLDKFKNYENSFSAVERNGQILEYVPKSFIDTEMCMAAVKSGYSCLKYVPKELLTQEICTEAVKANGKNIKNVPGEFMSSELGLIAVTSSDPNDSSGNIAGSNIQYIPEKYLTKEIIVESVRRWYSNYSRISKEYLTEDIEDAVLDASPYCIEFMKQTPERCMRALKINPFVIGKIKNENITKEMAEYILSLDYIKNQISEKILKNLYKIQKEKN